MWMAKLKYYLRRIKKFEKSFKETTKYNCVDQETLIVVPLKQLINFRAYEIQRFNAEFKRALQGPLSLGESIQLHVLTPISSRFKIVIPSTFIPS